MVCSRAKNETWFSLSLRAYLSVKHTNTHSDKHNRPHDALSSRVASLIKGAARSTVFFTRTFAARAAAVASADNYITTTTEHTVSGGYKTVT